MNRNSQHITFDDLFAFNNGRLDLYKANQCAKHLETCEECQNTLEAMQEFDSIELRQPYIEYEEQLLDQELLNITKQHIKSQKNSYIGKLKCHFYKNGWRYLAAVAASLLLIAFVEFIIPKKHNPIVWVRIAPTEIGGTYDEVRKRDSLALIGLYDVTYGYSWTNSWDLSLPMDTWHGVPLNEYGSVESLCLAHNNLKGKTPKAIGNLDSLKFLTLNDNQLSGSIPPSFENMHNLKSLCLHNNQLSGDIPHSIGETNLIYWGLAERYTGYNRPDATTAWIPQDSPEWDAFIKDVNSKHQDGDGNGIIDEADLAVSYSNYGASNIEVDTTGSVLQPTHYFTSYESDGNNHMMAFALTRTDKNNQLIDGPVASLTVEDKDVQIGTPPVVKANKGKMMSVTGVVTSVSGSTSDGSLGAKPFLATSPAYCQASSSAENNLDIQLIDALGQMPQLWCNLSIQITDLNQHRNNSRD